jgi:hypothetical protein
MRSCKKPEKARVPKESLDKTVRNLLAMRWLADGWR